MVVFGLHNDMRIMIQVRRVPRHEEGNYIVKMPSCVVSFDNPTPQPVLILYSLLTAHCCCLICARRALKNAGASSQGSVFNRIGGPKKGAKGKSATSETEASNYDSNSAGKECLME